ncbi:MAG TPA: bis(5'-nucleosyl)-tetraphosphatase (symmetrical) YqeK [Anaerovoracaceae bacterium]|nr:bis(5'-nucleosyl)-tetraphosphatase (symmetrical) YqeK [Anaerovoracaceae bacterium]
MKSIKFAELVAEIKRHIPENRIRHTLGVVSEAVRLAERYGADIKKAELAALGHDLCRNISIMLDHGKAAAEQLERGFGVTDKDILNAVCYHTTGRTGMSVLEKVIFVADKIEPGRDYFGVEELRKLAYEDLDKALLKILEQNISYLTAKGLEIHIDTLMAKDEILAKERREDE